MDDFVVFILTHGRPNNVKTYKTLRRQGYTGRIYLIIDNEDKTAPEYYKLYGEQVIMFDKLEQAKLTDAMDNFPKRNTVLFARNACFEIARQLGVTYFLELDDDYNHFRYRFNDKLEFIYNGYFKDGLDKLFKIIIEYYKSIPALTIALGQGGDFIGGGKGSQGNKLYLKRKAMNSFFCSVDRPFNFLGRMNDDVNTYSVLGHQGNLIFSMFNANIEQEDTQKQAGGLTEMYLEMGTYVKSFYTVMACPSFTKVYVMGDAHKRIHHVTKWANAVPVIMSEQHRKIKP